MENDVTYPDPTAARRRTASSGAGSSSLAARRTHAAVAVPARHRSLVQSHETQERTVTPRGDLAADEKTPSSCSRNRAGRWFTSPRHNYASRLVAQCLFRAARHRLRLLWDDAGHVVTNFHVIQGASSPRSNWPTVAIIRLRSLALVLARHRGTQDWRRLQAPAGRAVGTSADLKVGQKVFAIGNPFAWTGRSPLVSSPRSTARCRESGRPGHRSPDPDRRRHQPRHSGGPLLDSAGRLIGINTAITVRLAPRPASALRCRSIPSWRGAATHKDRQVHPSGAGHRVDEQLNARLQALTGSKGVFVCA